MIGKEVGNGMTFYRIKYLLNNENSDVSGKLRADHFLILITSRSSHRSCSVKKGVLRNFAKFRGKQLCQSLFFNKVFIKKETLAQVFSCEFYETSKHIFSTEQLRTTASEIFYVPVEKVLHNNKTNAGQIVQGKGG